MDERLQSLADQFRKKGLIVSGVPTDDQLLIQFSNLADYGITVMAGVGDGVSVSIWESYTGGTIGGFWTDNLLELIPLSLLKIASADTALSSDWGRATGK